MAALNSLPGCVALTPYPEAVASIPADRFIRIDGHQVHVEQQGEGDPILLLHGFAASIYSYRELAPRLAAHFRVVAIDLNGFGFTERPKTVEAYAPDGQLRTITGVMDQLAIGHFAVVGHSYGARLALLLAATRPERVRSLTLISPAPEFERPPWLLRTTPGRILAHGLSRVLLARPERFRKLLGNAYHQKEKLTAEVAEAYRARLIIEGLSDAFRGFGAAMRLDHGMGANLQEVDLPALVIAGRHDRIVSLDQCKGLADSLPRANLIVLENSGHSAPEEEPDGVAMAIIKFVENQRRDGKTRGAF